MAKYRVKANPLRYDGVPSEVPAGTVFEWDGEGDIDNEVYVDYGDNDAYVHVDYVEPVPSTPAPKAEVIEETRTVVEKVYVLRISEAEAIALRDFLENDDNPVTDDIFDRLDTLLPQSDAPPF